MTLQLSPVEFQTIQQQLEDYAPAQDAIASLRNHNGDLDASMEELMATAAGTAAYAQEPRKLKDVFLKNLRREICGDDSFLSKVEEYNKSPTKAALLTGLIVYVVDLVTLPINPAIATIVVLWMLKLGIRTFCDYTEPIDVQKNVTDDVAD